MEMVNSGGLTLTNVILNNEYAVACQPYEYFFFRVPQGEYRNLEAVELELAVDSGEAVLVLNEYMPNEPVRVRGSGTVRFESCQCEAGENVLAFKGQVRVQNIRLVTRENGASAETANGSDPASDPVSAAGAYLLNSRISAPERSSFAGSCYAIYDYTNRCHRMPCWLWSDAPVVYALLRLWENVGSCDSGGALRYKELACSIGEVMLSHQITDPADEVCGALTSRYRYYGKTDRSFHRLMGLNDTSYSVKWALLPLYEATGDLRYLEAARMALDWVQKNSRALDFLPSHYYYENRVWEERAFVDTGFCAEGFEQYMRIAGDRDYRKTMDFIMKRFIRQFKLDSGYYGQNFYPGSGVDDRLFTRGHAWVLEGLLACCRSLEDSLYRKEAEELCEKLAGVQNEDGSWNYLLGYNRPDRRIMDGSGICEKATAILAYLFLEYDRLFCDERIKMAGLRALAWCEANMETEPGPGFGGIAAESLSSGITGLPFLKVATGYANAYYVIARGMVEPRVPLEKPHSGKEKGAT